MQSILSITFYNPIPSSRFLALDYNMNKNENTNIILLVHSTVGLQWTLVITNSLGPVKLLCYIFCYIRVAKTIKYKEILNFGTKKITLLYQDFVSSVFFITRVHCTCKCEMIILLMT